MLVVVAVCCVLLVLLLLLLIVLLVLMSSLVLVVVEADCCRELLRARESRERLQLTDGAAGARARLLEAGVLLLLRVEAPVVASVRRPRVQLMVILVQQLAAWLRFVRVLARRRVGGALELVPMVVRERLIGIVGCINRGLIVIVIVIVMSRILLSLLLTVAVEGAIDDGVVIAVA